MVRNALTAIATCLAFSCTVANPLDYLQADRGETAGSGPGCPPASWSECGVTEVASGGRPNAISGSTWGTYYSDAEKGSIFELRCPGATCEAPKEVVSGESPAPEQIANHAGFLIWATQTQVRVILLPETLSGSGVINTADTVSGPVSIMAEPFAWSDAAGIRGGMGISLSTIHKHWSLPATSLVSMNNQLLFVSQNEVHTCNPDPFDGPCTSTEQTVPGGTGARLVTYAAGLFTLFAPLSGIVASIPRGGETEITHLYKSEDAGAYPVLARESAEVIALAASGTEVYFTTNDGRLRRWRKDSTEVDTLLRGLSADTALVALQGQAFVLDRELKKVLRVVP